MRWFQSGSRSLGLEMIFRRQKSRADRNAYYNGDTNSLIKTCAHCPRFLCGTVFFFFLTQKPSHSGQNSEGISEDLKYRRATANQDNIEARALGPIPVKYENESARSSKRRVSFIDRNKTSKRKRELRYT
jgi:hypothetical protein